jgi:hypothetical protein
MAGVPDVRVPGVEVRRAGTRDAPPGVVLQQWYDGDGRLIATGGRDSGNWWMHWAGLATFWFGESGDVIAEPARSSPSTELEDIFRRGVIPVVLLARGCEALHASAASHPGGVIAFCGTSGTGKSTLALALSALGLAHFADDTVVYRWSGGRPLALALPFPVRVNDPARRAAALRSASNGLPRSTDAALHRIYHLVRDTTLDPLSPRFVPVPETMRFERLLAHAHPFELGTDDRRRAFFESLMTLAREVEVWECRFAPALSALPALTSRIREHAAV